MRGSATTRGGAGGGGVTWLRSKLVDGPKMPPIDQPAWLAHAWAELGQHETPGSETNPHIRAFFADAGQPEVSSDETAWCAAFLGACLQRAGIPPSGSLLARSYLTWGELTLPRLGAIAVFSRDGDPTLGHVAFLIGETPDAFLLLGGNQHDAVTVAPFPKSRLLSLRWLAGASPGRDLGRVPQIRSGGEHL